jgi:hypothetical protein
VNRRGAVKKQLKAERDGSERFQQLNVKQLALKLVANSMYGCLGFSHSRFFAMALAELITLKVCSPLRPSPVYAVAMVMVLHCFAYPQCVGFVGVAHREERRSRPPRSRPRAS